MKKALIVGCLLMTPLLVSACRKKEAPQPQQATPKPRRTDKNVNQEPLENRPYVLLTPRSDGKAISMQIVEMKKETQDLEYEVEYTAGSLLQGAFGTIDSLSSLPISKEILLGSCSSGGKCTYNTGVTGGTLTLRFGNPDYTLKNEWSFTDQAKKQPSFASRDAKFSVDLAKAKNMATIAIVYQSPGYPQNPGGTVIAGPYSVSTAGEVTGNVTVSMRLPQDAQTGMMKAWDGTKWVALQSSVKEREVVATAPLYKTYVIVSQ